MSNPKSSRARVLKARIPQSGDRFTYKRKGERCFDYLKVSPTKQTYTLDERSGKFALSELVWDDALNAWRRDRSATPAVEVAPAVKKSKTRSATGPLELVFDFERETKNTVRFKQRVTGKTLPVVGTLYVQRQALGEAIPKQLSVTIQMEP